MESKSKKAEQLTDGPYKAELADVTDDQLDSRLVHLSEVKVSKANLEAISYLKEKLSNHVSLSVYMVNQPKSQGENRNKSTSSTDKEAKKQEVYSKEDFDSENLEEKKLVDYCLAYIDDKTEGYSEEDHNNNEASNNYRETITSNMNVDNNMETITNRVNAKSNHSETSSLGNDNLYYNSSSMETISNNMKANNNYGQSISNMNANSNMENIGSNYSQSTSNIMIDDNNMEVFINNITNSVPLSISSSHNTSSHSSSVEIDMDTVQPRHPPSKAASTNTSDLQSSDASLLSHSTTTSIGQLSLEKNGAKSQVSEKSHDSNNLHNNQQERKQNQKYNLRGSTKMPERLIPYETKSVNIIQRKRIKSPRNETSVRITLPANVDDTHHNSLLTLFYNIANFHGCGIACYLGDTHYSPNCNQANVDKAVPAVKRGRPCSVAPNPYTSLTNQVPSQVTHMTRQRPGCIKRKENHNTTPHITTIYTPYNKLSTPCTTASSPNTTSQYTRVEISSTTALNLNSSSHNTTAQTITATAYRHKNKPQNYSTSDLSHHSVDLGHDIPPTKLVAPHQTTAQGKMQEELQLLKDKLIRMGSDVMIMGN